MGFRVLSADCPWKFKDKLPGNKRGAEKHYPVMATEAIKAFELPKMLDDSVCFLWRVSAMQHDALDVMKAWGYTLKSELVWIKTRDKEPGQLLLNGFKPQRKPKHFGMGRIVRHAHEVCLIGVRGKVDRLSKSVPSVFEAPVGRHSEKPKLFYDIVEELFDGPYVELFARRKRLGWTTLGNDPALEIE